MFLALCMIAGGMAFAQRTVTGRVIDSETGEAVIGAAVKVVGTTLGAATDVNGRFTIQNVPEQSKLLNVSFIGMKTAEVRIRRNALIALEPDVMEMNEVMVVAYGAQKKGTFTGSAAEIKAEDIAAHISSDVTSALAGTTPGVQLVTPSGDPTTSDTKIRIRGIGSMAASSEPLIILDGMPFDGALSAVNPSDVASMTVLKDAAASAIYGARGANGVILITTKKGKHGDAKISFDAKWGSNSRLMPRYDIIDDPAQYYEAAFRQMYNSQIYAGKTSAEAYAFANNNLYNANNGGLGYQVYTVPQGQNLIGTNLKLNPNATLGYSDGQYYYQPDDWYDETFRSSFRQEYNMSVSGSGDRFSYYTSIGYLDDGGIINNSGYKRYTARINTDYQVKPWMKFQTNVSYSLSNSQTNNYNGSWGSSGNLFYLTNMIAPIYPAFVRGFDEHGNVVILTDEYGHERYDYGIASTYYGSTRAFLSTGNPLGANRWNKNFSKSTQLNGTLNAEIKFTPHLTGNVTSTVIKGFGDGTAYLTGFEGPSAGTNGAITKSMSNTTRTNNVQTLTYDNSFGDHNVNVLVGHEYYRTHGGSLGASARGAFTEDILEINAFASVPKGSASSYSTNYNVEGYFASAQYNYQNKYYGSLSFRRDASSNFYKKNRWGNFWSVGGAWIVSKEDFFSVPWVDILKLKASIGQQGNESVGGYNWIDLYNLTPSDDTHMSASFSSLGNKGITWETTTNFNVGAEFSLWQGRLSGEVDFYNKKTTDLLFWLSVPESVGARGYYGNMGDIRNYGVELSLNGSIIRTRDFQWNANLNLSHNDTRVLSLPDAKTGDVGGFTESGYWYEKGKPMYNDFSVRYAGVSDQGKALFWVDKDVKNDSTRPGKNQDYTTDDFNEASYYENGCILPKVFGGFGTGIVWKNFDASVMFDFQIGGKVFDSRYASLMSTWENDGNAGSAISVNWNKSWSETNATSDVPRWMFGDLYTAASSDRFMVSATYLNFQSFTVGYTIPANRFFKEQPAVRIYAAGENLRFWSARRGLDPRYSYGGNTTVAVYSPTRNISAGIQFTF